MQNTLLATKLRIPPIRPNLVPRPRLVERLNAGLHHKLTLISPPAGFGKTTLAASCVAGCGYPVAWLSLDKGDNRERHLLNYLIRLYLTLNPNFLNRTNSKYITTYNRLDDETRTAGPPE
jgi:LuxR family maltose regulon positive regulatory protein